MQEAFLETDAVSAKALQLLLKRQNQPALQRFILQYMLLVSAIAVILLAPLLSLPLWSRPLAVALLAVLNLSLFAILHETSHLTAFASRRWNQTVSWLVALPFFYTPTGFKHFHFAHHRFTHDPLRDPEISISGQAAPPLDKNLSMYLLYLTGLPMLGMKLLWLIGPASALPVVWERLLVFIPAHARRRMSWEARAILFCYGLLGLAGLAGLSGIAYLLLAQWLGHAIVSIYTLTEHTGLPSQGTILQRTRTTLTNPLMRWLTWNMPYHAEHHAYPAVPWQALPELHLLMQAELPELQAGYRSYHLGLIKKLSFRIDVSK